MFSRFATLLSCSQFQLLLQRRNNVQQKVFIKSVYVVCASSIEPNKSFTIVNQQLNYLLTSCYDYMFQNQKYCVVKRLREKEKEKKSNRNIASHFPRLKCQELFFLLFSLSSNGGRGGGSRFILIVVVELQVLRIAEKLE